MNALIERNNQVVDENRRKWQLNQHSKDVRLYLTTRENKTRKFSNSSAPKNVRLVQRQRSKPAYSQYTGI